MRGAVVDNYSNYGGSNYSNSGGPNLGYGEPSGAQRGLKVLAILHTIGGVLMLGLLLMWSVKAQANAESKISQASLLIQKLGEQGIVLSESESASLMLTIIIMAIAVLLSVAVLLTGVFGIRAANDPEKVTPYLVTSGILLATSGILLAYRIFDILATILNQTFTLTFWTLIGVGIPALAVWLGVSIKQQRDQARMPGAQR